MPGTRTLPTWLKVDVLDFGVQHNDPEPRAYDHGPIGTFKVRGCLVVGGEERSDGRMCLPPTSSLSLFCSVLLCFVVLASSSMALFSHCRMEET